MDPVGIVARWHWKEFVVLSFGFLQVEIRAGFKAKVKALYHSHLQYRGEGHCAPLCCTIDTRIFLTVVYTIP